MSATIQPSFRIDTHDYPDREAFESWHDLISATHQVEQGDVDALRFHVSFRARYLGQMIVSAGQFSAQTFGRDSQRVWHDQIDQYGLFVQGAGHRVARTGSDERVLLPGDLQIFDLAQPEVSAASDGNSGTLYLPRDLVDEAIPDFGRFHGVILRDGAARLVAQHILAMGHHLANVPVDALPSLTTATLEMALGCLTGATREDPEGGAAYESTLRRQVERYVDANLRDPGLTVESIGSAFALSRSTLYRLFEAHGGVANFVKTRRLIRIRSILIANVDLRPLAELAEDFGFQSGGHFSREFHKFFGCSPRDVRANEIMPSIGPHTGDSPLEAMLKMLHP